MKQMKEIQKNRGMFRLAILAAGCLLLASTYSFAAQPLAQQNVDLRALETVEQKVLAPLDLQQIRAQDATDELADSAPRFALPVVVDIRPSSDGTWQDLGDRRIWRYRVRSEVASSFNFGFTKFLMPAGGELWVYSPDFKSRFGPYTTANNHAHRQLWTPVVLGNEAVIELSFPAKGAEPELHLTQIGQGYRGFGAENLTPGPGCKPGQGGHGVNSPKSGSCNMDVACLGDSDPWQKNRRSVASQGTGGSRVCTGSLINNVLGDGRMLYITATHCGVTAASAPSLFVYWNFDAPTCRAPGSAASGSGAVIGATNQTQTGATFLAQTANPFAGSAPAVNRSDVTLVAFNNAPDPAHNVYWSGWDRRDVGSVCAAPADPTSTAGLCASIHHPSGDEKRITFVDQNMTTDNIASATGVHWRANWDATPPLLPNIPAGSANPPNVTEPGSSGSPLYNAEFRLVGVLSGGPSQCGSTGASLRDQYGKLAHAWEGLGTPATRVRDYLDPNNTGAQFMNGRSAVVINPDVIIADGFEDAVIR